MTRPESPYPGMVTMPILRQAVALEAAGAWDTAPAEFYTAGFEHLTLYVTYTRGAAAGAVNFRAEVSPYEADTAGVEDWFQMTLYDAGLLAPGGDVTSDIQREDITYTATAAAAEMFVYGPIDISGNVERVRIDCRETGNAANPGTCHIIGALW